MTYEEFVKQLEEKSSRLYGRPVKVKDHNKLIQALSFGTASLEQLLETIVLPPPEGDE